jgi:hypothetical protein
VRASPYQFFRYLGNPSEPKYGINHYFLETDQRDWFIPCLSCGKYSETDWFKTVVKEVRDGQGNIVNYILRDSEWHMGIYRDVHMICRCGGILKRSSNKGVWIPKNKEVINKVGYHISMLCSLVNNISDISNDKFGNLLVRIKNKGLFILDKILRPLQVIKGNDSGTLMALRLNLAKDYAIWASEDEIRGM